MLLDSPYISGNEQGYARTKTISFLEKFIQADDNDTSKDKLQNYEYCIPCTKLGHATIHSRKNICNCLTNSN